jgi:cell division topological specificity factor
MFNAFVKKLFRKNGSGETAKKRLQFALIYDRLEVSDDSLKKMQDEIITVISRYFVIDQTKLKLDITRENDLSALMFNTPIISSKSRCKSA